MPTPSPSPAHDQAQARHEARRGAQRWAWQRLSAAVLAVCVLVHLVVMVVAVHGGLSAAEILGRTQGHWGVAAFYALFVVACAVHAPIGLANIGREWWGWSARTAQRIAWGFGAVVLVLGLRAVAAVFTGGAMA